ncbi:STAS/SEC14 domain-containing protein [Flavobacterium sp. TMP13]|uniref:STAS/SEC14 domain-containing protein n=1 Tax=unclassified Flavobacterium TaxID=196869 RepID=UPI00076D8294|nr:STAS/SEC14 domain-containing protein [Flavobacterium sp. TAB 87]KVV16267.1 hypothetical protein AP058_00202 [Flavobacterium sp. TAB 87]
MIKHLIDVPENVAAFAVRAGVTIQDLRCIVIPALQKLVLDQGEINFLLELDADIPNFTLHPSFEALLLDLKNIGRWNRLAIVTDSSSIMAFTSAFIAIMPQEFKGFNKDLYSQARIWVSQTDH